MGWYCNKKQNVLWKDSFDLDTYEQNYLECVFELLQNVLTSDTFIQYINGYVVFSPDFKLSSINLYHTDTYEEHFIVQHKYELMLVLKDDTGQRIEFSYVFPYIKVKDIDYKSIKDAYIKHNLITYITNALIVQYQFYEMFDKRHNTYPQTSKYGIYNRSLFFMNKENNIDFYSFHNTFIVS